MKNSKVDLKDNQKLNTNLINTTANETAARKRFRAG